LFWLLAQKLGKENFGVFRFAVVYAELFAIFSDFGLRVLSVRDIARERQLIVRYVNNIIPLKLALSVVAFLAMWSAINLMGQPAETKFIVYLVGVSVMLNSLVNFISAAFNGFERMEYETVIVFIHYLCLLALVGCGLMLGYGVLAVASLWLAARFLAAVAGMGIYFWHVRQFKPEFSFSFWKELLGKSWYFGLYAFVSLIYVKVDTVMLKYFGDNAQVGEYQAAVMLMMYSMFLVDVMINAILPVLSRKLREGREVFNKIVFQFNKASFAIVAPIVVFTFFFSSQIIAVLGSEYSKSAPLLRLLAVAYLFYYGPPYGVAFLPIDKQQINFAVSLVCAIINLGLNLIFIPKYGAVAAAGTTIATYVLMKGLYAFYYRKFRIPILDLSFLYIFAILVILASILTFVNYCFVLSGNHIGLHLRYGNILHILLMAAIYLSGYILILHKLILKPVERAAYMNLIRSVAGRLR